MDILKKVWFMDLKNLLLHLVLPAVELLLFVIMIGLIYFFKT